MVGMPNVAVDDLDDIYGPAPMPLPTVKYDPAVLVAAMEPMSLRQVAHRLGVDPALMCRQWSHRQADRYATALGLHAGDVWGSRWWRPELYVPAA